MRAFKPKGVRIWRHIRADQLTFMGPRYELQIKSCGRTGAALRSRLQRMTPAEIDPIANAWWHGCVADFPNTGEAA